MDWTSHHEQNSVMVIQDTQPCFKISSIATHRELSSSALFITPVVVLTPGLPMGATHRNTQQSKIICPSLVLQFGAAWRERWDSVLLFVLICYLSSLPCSLSTLPYTHSASCMDYWNALRKLTPNIPSLDVRHSLFFAYCSPKGQKYRR